MRDGDSDKYVHKSYHRGGKKVKIAHIDNERDALHYEISNACEGIATKVDVKPLGDRWFRIEITVRPRASKQRVTRLFEDLDAAFLDKGWYESRDSDPSEDDSIVAYEVRHRSGYPMI